jgi:DNA polymerase-3 subunit delta
MAASSFDSIRKTIARGDIAPVYYVGGDDELRKDEFIDSIVHAVLPEGVRDFNLDVRSAADLNGESLYALVETPPMLAERRAVVIRGLEQWRKNAKVWEVLHRYLDQPSPTTLLVLVQSAGEPLDGAVAAKARCAESGLLEGEALLQWIGARAARVGVTLGAGSADHLIRAVGSDTSQLAAELDKLAAARGDRPVTTDDVAAMVGVRHGETQSDWIDAVARRDTKTALALLDIVLPQGGVSGVRMIAALGTQLVGLRLARALLDRGLPTSRLAGELLQQMRTIRPMLSGSWNTIAGVWASAAPSWKSDELDAALRAAYEADRQLKATTVTDERGALANLVLGLSLKELAA